MIVLDTLVSNQPGQSSLHADIFARDTCLLERECDQAGCVSVALHYQWCAVPTFPRPDEGRQTPVSICLPLTQNLVNDGFLLLVLGQSGKVCVCIPQSSLIH